MKANRRILGLAMFQDNMNRMKCVVQKGPYKWMALPLVRKGDEAEQSSEPEKGYMWSVWRETKYIGDGLKMLARELSHATPKSKRMIPLK